MDNVCIKDDFEESTMHTLQQKLNRSCRFAEAESSKTAVIISVVVALAVCVVIGFVVYWNFCRMRRPSSASSMDERKASGNDEKDDEQPAGPPGLVVARDNWVKK
jgi:hypothetical protein